MLTIAELASVWESLIASGPLAAVLGLAVYFLWRKLEQERDPDAKGSLAYQLAQEIKYRAEERAACAADRARLHAQINAEKDSKLDWIRSVMKEGLSGDSRDG